MKKILINQVSICDFPRELSYTKSLLEDILNHRRRKFEKFIKRISFVNFIIYISLVVIDLRFGLKEYEKYDLLFCFLILFTIILLKSANLKMTISSEDLEKLKEKGKFILPKDELEYISRMFEREEFFKRSLLMNRHYVD